MHVGEDVRYQASKRHHPGLHLDRYGIDFIYPQTRDGVTKQG